MPGVHLLLQMCLCIPTTGCASGWRHRLVQLRHTFSSSVLRLQLRVPGSVRPAPIQRDLLLLRIRQHVFFALRLSLWRHVQLFHLLVLRERLQLQ